MDRRWNWRFWWCLLLPIILSPVIFIQGQAQKFKCLYVILVMGSFWVVEAMPIAITGLLPVALFPLLGLQSTSQVVSNYMKESGMMFVGSISLALSIQHSGLHKRIALKTLILVGTGPWRLLLGLLLTTFLLSCAIGVNTSVAAMMVPITHGLVDSLGDIKSEERERFGILFFLAVGYAANIGGTAVMTGSVPNLVYKSIIELENVSQNGKYTDINFATWAAFNAPISAINLLIVWLVLGFFHLRKGTTTARSARAEEIQLETPSDAKVSVSLEDNNFDLSQSEAVKGRLAQKLLQLGSFNFHEKAVLTIYIATVLLWFLRDPELFDGWANGMYPNDKMVVQDSTVSILMLTIMFIIPKDPTTFIWTGDTKEQETLMSWKFILENFPWTVLFLLGGGFAISDGADKSGLSAWVGELLTGLDSLPPYVLLLIILFVISILTEFTANAATVSLLTPIMVALSRKLDIHPLYISFPGAIACQYAFVLPTSNPPNALVFGAGNLKIMDMVKPGIVLNFICLLVLYLMSISWGQVIFNFDNFQYVNATKSR